MTGSAVAPATITCCSGSSVVVGVGDDEGRLLLVLLDRRVGLDVRLELLVGDVGQDLLAVGTDDLDVVERDGRGGRRPSSRAPSAGAFLAAAFAAGLAAAFFAAGAFLAGLVFVAAFLAALSPSSSPGSSSSSCARSRTRTPLVKGTWARQGPVWSRAAVVILPRTWSLPRSGGHPPSRARLTPRPGPPSPPAFFSCLKSRTFCSDAGSTTSATER